MHLCIRADRDLVAMQEAIWISKWLLFPFDQIANDITKCLCILFGNVDGCCRVYQHFVEESSGEVRALRRFENAGMMFRMQSLYIHAKTGKQETIFWGCPGES